MVEQREVWVKGCGGWKRILLLDGAVVWSSVIQLTSMQQLKVEDIRWDASACLASNREGFIERL
jgi:hypothetical protein